MKLNSSTKVELTTSSGNIRQCTVSRRTFYLGDCLVEMDKIADKSVDMILCDLPYGTTACKWDSVIPFEPLWKHYERIIKDNGAIVLTASQPFTSAMIMSNPKLFKYEWIWRKNSGSGFGNANRMPLKEHESCLVFYKKQPLYNAQRCERKGGGASRVKYGFKDRKDSPHFSTGKDKGYRTPDRLPGSVIDVNVEKGLHPTQKPVLLMEYLIKTYTNEGETVLDNCMGSGSTGVACKKTGRHFIGIEKDEKYFEIAKNRIYE